MHSPALHIDKDPYKLSVTSDPSVGGGGNWPIKNPKGYFSGTKCGIDLKTGFKVVKTKLIDKNIEGTMEDVFTGKGSL